MVVVDASAALKWVLDEPGQNDALGLLDEDILHAPDFLLVEVANVLWSKVRAITRYGVRSCLLPLLWQKTRPDTFRACDTFRA